MNPPTRTEKPDLAPQAGFRARLGRLYSATKPYHKVAAFLVGFLWDVVMLKRIEQVLDNARLAAYLVVLGLLLVYLGRSGAPEQRKGSRLRRVCELAARFLFGGLFSAYVVFYFKSASIGPSLIFLGILAALFLGNEFMEDLFSGRRLQLALYFFCSFSFLLYAIPTFIGIYGKLDFALSGAASLLWTWILYRLSLDRESTPSNREMLPWLATFSFLALMYWLNLIPPVPLSIMHAGVYHDVQRTEQGYRLVYGTQPLQYFFADYDRRFVMHPGDKACCFSAVFAPTGTELQVFHVWERATPGGWSRTDRIPLRVVGGRGQGYRSYTCKRRIGPGEWRVSIRDQDDRELGTVDFIVVEGSPSRDTEKQLTTMLY